MPQLRTAYLEILHGCNLGCKYCYIGDDKNHREPFIAPLAALQARLDKLVSYSVPEVVLLGGEPLLHPQIPAILAYAHDLRFESLGIVSNGTVSSSEKLDAIVKSGAWVNLTARGANASTFDEITGIAGSFTKLTETVRLLAGRRVPIGLEYDCTPSNWNQLERSVEDVLGAGATVRQVQLHRILPAGNAASAPDRHTLQPQQWSGILEQAARIRDSFGIPVGVEDGLPLCLVDRNYWDLLMPCGCGYSQLTIDPYGEVRFCSCHDQTLGNMDTSSFPEIWEQSLRAYRATDRLPAECRRCELASRCRGGCTASGQGPMVGGADVFAHLFKAQRKLSESDGQFCSWFSQRMVPIAPNED